MKRRSYFFTIAVMLLLTGKLCSQNPGSDSFLALYNNLPFKMEFVRQPEFSANTVNIIDFGAKGDGITSNTKAIANAIDAIVKKGGGTVIIPEGTWVTGPVILKSNIRIHTLKGALIVFSRNHSEYPLIQTWYEGLQSWRCMAPLYAENAENIAITGDGIFDGSGETWRPAKKFLMVPEDWDRLITKGGVLSDDAKMLYPDSSAYLGSKLGSPRGVRNEQEAQRIKTFLRPVMLNFVNCKKVLIEGATFQNTPSWCLHPVLCQDITISNVKVFNEPWVVNGDALDLESCKNVLVYNSLFDAGDDAICMKSGRDEEGRKRGVPTENVIISNCSVYRGHGGFVIGSEMSGGVRNVKISKCTFMGTDNGLRFKSTRGRGGVVENIYVSDINMVNIVHDAILFDLYYFVKEKSSVVPSANETTPQFRDISIKNVVCKGAERAILLQGLPEMNLENINFENITIESKTGMYCNDATNIKFNRVYLSSKVSPVIKINNVRSLTFENLSLSNVDGNIIQIEGKETSKIEISGKEINSGMVSIAPSVSSSEVIIKKSLQN